VVVTLDPDIVKIGTNNIPCRKENRCVGFLAGMLDDSTGHDR